jgi:hypothetical protein
MDTAARPIAMSLHASGGQAYVNLKKGTSTWGVAMVQVATIKASVDSIPNHSYRPIAVTVVHGETDNFQGNAPLYQGYLEEWQRDYETDIRAIVNSPVPIPMFVSQMNTGWTGEMAVAQYKAHKDNPGKIFLIGPKYQYTYHTDNLHLRNVDSKHFGEMFAKVINEVVLKGNAWNPLMPTLVHRIDNVITVSYHIPVGNLEIDTSIVARRRNYGFDFVQTGGNVANIIDVQLVNGATKVQITLDSVPTGTNQLLRYGYSCYKSISPNFADCGGSAETLAVGGNIRDMDAQVSQAIGGTGMPLYNWGVTFEEPVVDALVAVADPHDPNLEVFPNPVTSVLHVRRLHGAQGMQGLVLFDLAGREVLRQTFAFARSEAALELNGLPAGMYMLRVRINGRPDANVKIWRN